MSANSFPPFEDAKGVQESVTLKIYKTLLERFGEPIEQQTPMVGARDEGPGGKALWDDEPLDREWSDPKVVHESDEEVCNECGTAMNQCGCGAPVAEAKKKPGPRKGVVASVRNGVVTQRPSKAKTPDWVRKAVKSKPAPNEPLHHGLRKGKVTY